MKRESEIEHTQMKKKSKFDSDPLETEESSNLDDPQHETPTGFMHLDDNLLFEVLKHVDAKSLAMASCVNKVWHKTAQDERLWELICTEHWANMGCGIQQFRSVVLALGGFRKLHSQYLCPLSKPQGQSSSSSSASASVSAWGRFAPMIGSKPPAKWGKDEVHLSLSLLSIKYYEKMHFNNIISKKKEF